VRDAVPRTLATWNQIGVGVAATASNLDRLTKPHWYDRLIGYGLNGVLIYRNLNPVTSLTVAGATTGIGEALKLSNPKLNRAGEPGNSSIGSR